MMELYTIKIKHHYEINRIKNKHHVRDMYCQSNADAKRKNW